MLPLLGARIPRYIAAAGGAEVHSGIAGADVQFRMPPNRRQLVPLFLFTGLCVLAISGDTIKFAFLPIYMERVLHTPASLRGAVIAIQPFFELLLIPLFRYWADRLGGMQLVLVGTLLGLVANASYALSQGVAGLFVAQILMAGLWAAIAGLGINVAQHLYPQGVGVASSTFLSAIPVASSLGGLVGSIGVTQLGMPGVFYVPAVLCAVSALGLFTARPTSWRQRDLKRFGGEQIR